MGTKRIIWGNVPHLRNHLLTISLLLLICDFKVSALFPPVNAIYDISTPCVHNSIIDKQLERTTRSLDEHSNESKDTIKSNRLIKTVIPDKYFLTITPILEPGFEKSVGEQWFAPGRVSISVRAIDSTESITLHSKNITIHNVTITNHDGENIPVKNVTFHKKHSFMTIHLSRKISTGVVYEIDISFTSFISEVLNGLFRSSYQNEETGKPEWFVATHMEALHARQMFPNFDEPSYKAIIQAKIGRQNGYTALFNTESLKIETMENAEGWVWETFAPSVPMSTYLTALVVSKFQYSEASGKLLPSTRVRTYAPPHFVRQGSTQYSADTAERVLYTYGEYFQQKYPMKKFDSVAVPSFLYGAMENYGLSIFRETLLLHFKNQTSESQRYVVTNVICHELGHQWFGNLVSPNWWTHLWLSEGLTKFTEYIGLNATIPEFKPWDIFISESLQMGLRLDADQRTSHSLKIDENAWSLKSEMEWFDDIAYKKGGSMIRMMRGFLTEPVLRKGLSRYLSRMKFQAANQDDLFSDCDKEGQLANKLPENTTLSEVMNGWTLQSGFPLLKVEHVPKTNNIRVFQEKYSASRAAREAGTFSEKWFVPVSVATTNNPSFDPEPEYWIRNNESSVLMTLPTGSWIILNAGTTGFYRVIYDEELSRRITDQLMAAPNKIHRFARSQLMDDYFSAALNRYIPMDRALNLTGYMKEHAETEHVVWTSLLTMLKLAIKLFRDSSEDFDIFREYMLPRIEKAINATGGYNAINMNSAGLPVVRHAQFLDWACNLEAQGCINYATEVVNAWRETGVLEAPPDFRVVLLSSVIANDESGSMFDFMMEQYKNSTHNNLGAMKLKEDVLAALSNTRNKRNMKLLLHKIFGEGGTGLNSQDDALLLLKHLASNIAASDTILKYFVENYQGIVKRFGSYAPITATANIMAPHLKSLSGLFLIEELVKNDEELLNGSFSPIVNRIRANIVWYDEFGEDMLEFFEQNK